MAQKSDLRLRLKIKRHSLPVTRVMWTLDKHRSEAFSIADLLGEVNEIIPLEADDWGLEDYAVECGGFDCLHFQTVRNVLRDLDLVDIRPYSSTELRMRKLAGRVQISSDGKHLIDGVAFGRLYTGRSSRPPVRIPPRKRRRLTYDQDGDEDVDEVVDESRLLLEDAYDHEHDNDEESDASFEPDDDGGHLESVDGEHEPSEDSDDSDDGGDSETARQEAANELSGLSSLWTDVSGRDHQLSRLGQGDSPSTNNLRLVLRDGHSVDLVDENGQTFPQWYHNALLDRYETASPRSSPSLRAKRTPSEAISSTRTPKRTVNKFSTPNKNSTRRSILRSPNASNKSVHFEAGWFDSSPKGLLPFRDSGFDEEDDSLDGDFDGPTAESTSSDSDANSTSSEASTSMSASPQSSSPLSSSQVSSSPSSSSISSSSTDNSSQHFQEAVRAKPLDDPQRNKASIARAADRQGAAPIKKLQAPPGGGSKATKKRNERRKLARQLASLARRAASEAEQASNDVSMTKTHETDLEPAKDHLDVVMAGGAVHQEKEEFEAKRQKLLAAIASGGVEVPWDGNARQDRPGPSQEVALVSAVNDSDPGNPSVVSERTTQDTVNTTKDQSRTEQVERPAARFRPKLDMASTRRMLLSNLGLRVSKAKQDQRQAENSGQSLPELGSRSGQNSRHIVFNENGLPTAQDTVNAQSPAQQPQEPQEPQLVHENWQERIILDAVECCEEGVTLSTPPFPFVQRWDPQQRLSDKTAKKTSKKRKRNQAQYYQDDEDYLDYGDDHWVDKDAAPTLNGSRSVEGPVQDVALGTAGDMITHAVEQQLAINQSQLPGKEVEQDDIPAMPSDTSTCPVLRGDDIRVGAIIGFKRLVMTASWQPELSGYQTAKVEQCLDGSTMQLTLAKRNRERKERHYDETGERVYGKFEVPDDNESEADDAPLELSFSELIEPRLVQPGPESPAEAELAHSGIAVPDSLQKSTETGGPRADTDMPDSFQKPTDEAEAHHNVNGTPDETSKDNANAGLTDGRVEPMPTSDDFLPDHFASPLDPEMQQVVDHPNGGNIVEDNYHTTLQLGSEPMELDKPESPTFSGLGLDPLPQDHPTSQETFRTPQGSGQVPSPGPENQETHMTQRSSPVRQQSPDEAEVAPVRSPRDSRSDQASSNHEQATRSVTDEPKIGAGARPDKADAPGRTYASIAPGQKVELAVRQTHAPTYNLDGVSKSPPRAPDIDESSSVCELPELDTMFTHFHSSWDGIKDESGTSQATTSRQKKESSPPVVISSLTSTTVSKRTSTFKFPPPSSSAPPPRGVAGSRAVPEVVDLTHLSDGDLTHLSDGVLLPADDPLNDPDYEDDAGDGLPAGPGWVEKLRSGAGRAKRSSVGVRGRKRLRVTAGRGRTL